MSILPSMIMYIFSWLFSICNKFVSSKEYDPLKYICKFIMWAFSGKIKQKQNE